VQSAAFPIDLEDDDGPPLPQPTQISATNLRLRYPVWFIIFVDASDYVLDVAFAEPYGGWLDLSNATRLHVVCRDTLAEMHEFYVHLQNMLSLGDRRYPERSTSSVSDHHISRTDERQTGFWLPANAIYSLVSPSVILLKSIPISLQQQFRRLAILRSKMSSEAVRLLQLVVDGVESREEKLGLYAKEADGSNPSLETIRNRAIM
jgi:hypothetical protein